MMRLLFLMLGLACCAAPARAQTLEELRKNGHSTAAIQVDDERNAATIKGRTGILVIDRDKVELRDRTVYVNGKSYGAVPAWCEIRFVMSKEGNKLYVDGKLRAEPAPRP